jgi:hypothetical protein
MTPSVTTFIITTFCIIMMLGIMTFSIILKLGKMIFCIIITLGKISFCITALGKMTFCLTTLSIKGLLVTLNINNTQHYDNLY